MMAALHRWRAPGACWWLPGHEFAVPFVFWLCIPCGLLALVLAFGFQTSAGIAIVVAIAPLLIAVGVLPVGAVMRIASVQRSEALLLLPARPRRLSIATLTLTLAILLPTLGTTLMIHHGGPLSFGMLWVSVLLLAFWGLRKYSAGAQPTYDIRNALWVSVPALALPQAHKLGLYSNGAMPLVVTAALCLICVAWRVLTIHHTRFDTSRPWRMPGLGMRNIPIQLLWRVAAVLLWVLFYRYFFSGNGPILMAVMFAFVIDRPDLLRDRLRLCWLNGMNRDALLGHAMREALRDQLPVLVLSSIGLLLVAATGWIEPMRSGHVIIALACSAVPLLFWQLLVIAWMPRSEDGSATMRSNLKRSLPTLVAWPWLLGLMVALDLFPQNLTHFSLACAALALCLTLIGIPLARRRFQRIEL